MIFLYKFWLALYTIIIFYWKLSKFSVRQKSVQFAKIFNSLQIRRHRVKFVLCAMEKFFVPDWFQLGQSLLYFRGEMVHNIYASCNKIVISFLFHVAHHKHHCALLYFLNFKEKSQEYWRMSRNEIYSRDYE